MRAVGALVVKEVQQHGLAFVGALALTAAVLVCLWFVALEEDGITLLAAIHQLALFVLPALVLFVDGRLVVHDHQHGTHEFLAALPIGPVARTAVRFGVGLAVIEGAAMAMLLATAALASRREGVPLGWVLQLAAQVGLSLGAWHGVAFGIAHLGGYRWLAWWTLLSTAPVVALLVDDPPSTFYWFGLVLDGPDRTRLAPPWETLPVTVAWGAAGLALAVGLATWRGGALLERAFRPTTADQRARLIGAGVAVMLVSSGLSSQAPERDLWTTLPAVPARTAVLRVAASEGDPLWDVGTKAAAALDGLGAELGVEAWPPTVLLRSRAEPGRRAVRPAPTDENERSRVLLVDPDHPPDDLVRRVVTEVVVHRLAGLAGWDPDARWLAEAAGPWWLATDRELLGRRAALGVGSAAAAAEDWTQVVAELGPDVASGVAWAGLVALEAEAGRDGAVTLLRAVLAPERATRWASGTALRGTTRGDWTGRLIGVERDRWVAAWETELARGSPPALPDLPALRLTEDDGVVLASWDGPVPPGTTLEYAVVDPLQQGWLPGDETEILTLSDDLRELQLRVDVRARVLAQLVVDEPQIAGQIGTAWAASR